MARHTAGPWAIEDARGAMGSTNPNLPFDDPERVANAWLLAAAPEMLHTLKGIVRILVAVQYTIGLAGTQLVRLAAAQAVIAKAEGRP